MWIKCDDLSQEPPFTKVCVYDGANTFWAYLQSIEKTSSGRRLNFDVQVPEGYGKFEPTHYRVIEYPLVSKEDQEDLWLDVCKIVNEYNDSTAISILQIEFRIVKIKKPKK